MTSLRTILGLLLLAFASVSMGVIVVREVRGRGLAADAGSNPSGRVLTIYIFHGNQRCDDCERMERFTREAVEQGFSGELASGKLGIAVRNYEAPENQSLRKACHIAFSSVVLVSGTDGRSQIIRRLDDVPSLLGEREKFIRYIRSEVAAALKDL